MKKYYDITIIASVKARIDNNNKNQVTANLVDNILKKDEQLSNLHESWGLKPYSLSEPWFPDRDVKVLDIGNITTIKLRTVDSKLALSLTMLYRTVENDFLKIEDLIIEENNIPDKIYALRSVTPVLIQDKKLGYWRNRETEEKRKKALIERLQWNGANKYKKCYEPESQEDIKIDFIKDIRVGNLNFKVKTSMTNPQELFSDKMTIFFKEDDLSQKVAKAMFVLGIGHSNARTMGFAGLEYEEEDNV